MSRFARRALLGVLIVILVLLVLALGGGYLAVRLPFPQTEGTLSLPGLDSTVEVYRDSLGIPHLYASTTHDLLMAQGFVHAQDRFWQMEFWRRIGAGRLAEVLGESALESDVFIRTVGWHRTAQQELALLDTDTRSALDAYAEGVNAYLAQKKGGLGLEFTILGLTGVKVTPEPWAPGNTLTWAKVMAWDLGGNMSEELLRAEIAARLGESSVSELVPPYPEDAPVIVPHPVGETSIRAIPDIAFGSPRVAGLGSNNWVVAGSRTETGMPLLANDPHLSIQMPSIWYEIGLHCEPIGEACPLNVVGASFPGGPGVIIGHNDRIAWGVTNLGPDVQDLFIERINPQNPNQYEFKGEWLDMQVVREEIQVAGRDDPVVVLARITQHGPIINDVVGGEEESWSFGWQPLALSWTALQPGVTVRSILLLDRAQNWEQFREALSYWDVPSQNFVYADVDGNIGYQAPGRIPVRAAGDGTMPVPGWTGEYEWIDTIPSNDLPYAFNPPEGYVVTANNAVVSADFPYLITRDWQPPYRAQRIIELIEADPTVSWADMQAVQSDSASVWARQLLPHLLALSPSDGRLREAIDLLRAWDGRAVRDSSGAVLLESLRKPLIDLTFGDELGEHLLNRARGTLDQVIPRILLDPHSHWFDNIHTPEVEDRDAILTAALDQAVEDLTESLGRDMRKWRWGDLHTATFENQSLGQSGIAPIEAIFNRGPVEADGSIETVNDTAYDPEAPFSVTTVPSYRQIIDLGDLSQSVSIHTTGQSGHPFHPHYDDMIDMWRNFLYHPMRWGQAEIEASAESHLTLTP